MEIDYRVDGLLFKVGNTSFIFHNPAWCGLKDNNYNFTMAWKIFFLDFKLKIFFPALPTNPTDESEKKKIQKNSTYVITWRKP